MNFIELSLVGAKLVDPDNGLAIAIPDRLRGALGSGLNQVHQMITAAIMTAAAKLAASLS